MGKYKDKVTVSVTNFHSIIGDVAANLEKMESFIVEASKQGAEMILFGEMIMAGYPRHKEDAPLVLSKAEPIPGPSTERIAKLSAKHNIWVFFGMPRYTKEDPNAVYNSVAIVAPNGVVGFCDKAHLSTFVGEPLIYRHGSGKDCCFMPDTPWGPIGVAICYDLHSFPEWARALRVQGARLLMWASATAYLEEQYRLKGKAIGLKGKVIDDQLIMVRARDDRMFIAWSNHFGEQRGYIYYGDSQIVGPDPDSRHYSLGKVYAHCGDKKEGIGTATLDLSIVDRLLKQWDFLGDRRPELYVALLSNEQQKKLKQ